MRSEFKSENNLYVPFAESEAKLLKTFLRTLILMTQVSLPVLPSRTNLKLRKISVSSKMIKKVIMNFDLSKASGPDCTPVVVLMN